jgi:hypothetical protein
LDCFFYTMMKTSFTHFSPNAAARDHYTQGVDYLTHDFDLEFDDTLYLLRELRNHRSRLSVQASRNSVDFYIESDGSLRVEIYDDNGLWADSEVEVGVAVEILRMAFAGAEFGKFIPTTNREWDAYSGILEE